MKLFRNKLYTGLLGVTLAALLTLPAAAAPQVLEVDGENIWDRAGTRMVEETTYASLRTLAEVLVPEAEVLWQDGTARVRGEGLELRARPGDIYITVNDRVIYAPLGVRAEQGSVLVPVRAVAEILGSTVEWSSQRGAVITTGTGVPQAAPYTEDELLWMGRIIYAESRGEPLLGKLAVGTVVLNRVASRQFPDTIYGVIFDREWGVQFQPVSNGTIYNTPDSESLLAARMVLDGARAAGDSLYFLAPHLTDNHWVMENRELVTKIGAHWFYR